jgi:transposase
MFNSKDDKITDAQRFFLETVNSTHRQYEALRAYFVDGLSTKEAARRFGYSEGSFRVLVHQFRHNPPKQYFMPPAKGPQKKPQKDPIREKVTSLRKENLSIYDISKNLAREDITISPVSISTILKEEGFARLPRRRDDERPPGIRPTPAAVADVRQLDLSPRHIRTKFGGLFLFLAELVQIPFEAIIDQAGLPGSTMIPASHAVRSLLALKLFGSARHSHVMSYVLDEGLGLFSGLNVIPKRSFLTEYSCRVDPSCYPSLMKLWFDAMSERGLERGTSFDLDFHTIPFHGEDALMEKHYVSKRSRRQKGILAFLAQDAENRVFCYANASVRKQGQNDEILRFIEFWQTRTGILPRELIFDSKLTIYQNLNRLNNMGIAFITLRRRSQKMVLEAYNEPISAWRRIELKGVSRTYKHPRIIDRKISLRDYDGPIRQIIIADLGHDDPTYLLTNQLTSPAHRLINRYAQRMIIENGIADGIDFFHMDALSSTVAMKVDFDLQLTLMANSLYRLMGAKIGNGYARAKSKHIFRDFIDATAMVTITDDSIEVRFQKRSHNPLLKAAGYDKLHPLIPWLGGKILKIFLG